MSCDVRARAFYKDNSMIVQLGALLALGDDIDAPLTDGFTSAVITDATVAAQVKDPTGTLVGASIPMPHLSGGVYAGVAPAALPVEVGLAYVVEIVATKAGFTATFRDRVLVEERTG